MVIENNIINNINKYSWIKEIKDSKKLNPKKREQLSINIKQYCYYEITAINVSSIDNINILQASLLAMYNSSINLVEKLNVNNKNTLLTIDGNKDYNYLNDKLKQKTINTKQIAIVNGDNQLLSIAAASILAKCYRDKLMYKLSTKYQIFMTGIVMLDMQQKNI